MGLLGGHQGGSMSKRANITERVLAAIKAHPGPSAKEISQRVGITIDQARTCLSNLVHDGRLYSDGPLSQRRYHIPRGSALRTQFSAPDGREPPVKNSLMPNGSPEYWRGFLAEMNTPARADAGSLK
jgi:hypothetical protein